jgi:hypothetical protein
VNIHATFNILKFGADVLPRLVVSEVSPILAEMSQNRTLEILLARHSGFMGWQKAPHLRHLLAEDLDPKFACRKIRGAIPWDSAIQLVNSNSPPEASQFRNQAAAAARFRLITKGQLPVTAL